jgi:hypothetical protein
MGQYGNQPDFGTRAANISPVGTPGALAPSLQSAALYIGVGGNLTCSVVGGNGLANYTVFQNIPDGTFFPVIVNHVFVNEGGPGAAPTTCSSIVALY